MWNALTSLKTWYNVGANRLILLVSANTVLFATCFWIQNGIVPFLVGRFHASALVYGYLQTTFAVLQLAGGPLVGRFGDRFGARPALLVTVAAAATSYTLLAMADSVAGLFASMAPSVAMHTMQAGQMAVTDLTDHGGRSAALTRLSICYGAGMVAGSLIGGVVSKRFGLQSGAYLAAIGSVASIFLIYLCFPRGLNKSADHEKIDDDSNGDQKTKSLVSLSVIKRLLTNRITRILLTSKLATGLALGIIQSSFSLVAIQQFKMDTQNNGYLIAYIATLSMIVQVVTFMVLLRKFDDFPLLKVSTFIILIGNVIMIFVDNMRSFVIALHPIVIGMTIKNVLMSSMLTKVVPPSETGEVLGVNMAVNSLIRIVSPSIGGLLLYFFGFHSFGVFGSVMSLASLIYLCYV